MSVDLSSEVIALTGISTSLLSSSSSSSSSSSTSSSSSSSSSGGPVSSWMDLDSNCDLPDVVIGTQTWA